MKKILLQGRSIVKSFSQGDKGIRVLDNIDIEIYEGDFTVIMGASGAGKSTLLHNLSGMDMPDGGSVLFREKEITKCSEKEMAKLRTDEFGFVFQKTHLVTSLSLYENIVLAGYLSGKLSEAEAEKRADILVEQMNLSDAKERLPSAVSGGEAQRTAVARAVIGMPSILFADEPTGALNRKNSEEVMNILTSLAAQGQTVLLVTHDIRAALHGNRILYLEDGRISGELELEAYNKADRSREDKLNSWLTTLRW
ncbi:MAG: ABC transporter ATP-binding protein [Clostridium sp.]|nr:ABC transporter ATP-binding protein [Clostridium sp.]